MVNLLVTLLVTTASMLAISYLPIGVNIRSIDRALIAAIVFGVLNTLLSGILFVLLAALTLPLMLLTFGLFGFVVRFVVNVLIFGLAAKIVDGFELENGWSTAALGAVALSLVNFLI
ncbi:MAG: phage holin family protein, partial [Cyanobacteria bacterium J06598_3]